MDIMPVLVDVVRQNRGITMTEHFLPGRRASCGWRALIAPLRAPFVATNMFAGPVGAVLMLLPAEVAWPGTVITAALASADVFDWVKGLLGLIFLLRRHLGSSQGERQ